MTRTLKILSALLSYPTAELQNNISDMQDIVGREGVLTGQARRALNPLFENIARGELYDLQERYVLLFDRTRSLSLHLFEHVHGESRDRGQAVVDLQSMYLEKGLEPGTSELPVTLAARGSVRSARSARAYLRGHCGAAAQAQLAV